MRIISNQELGFVSGGSAMIITTLPIAAAIVEQTETWASNWGLDYSSYINGESSSGGGFGASGGGTLSADSKSGALQLLENIKKSLGVQASIKGTLKANSEGQWDLIVNFEVSGKIGSGK